MAVLRSLSRRRSRLDRRPPWQAARALGLLWVAAIGLSAGSAASESPHFIWIDPSGVTHLTDDPDSVPENLRHPEGSGWEATRALWADGFLGLRTGTPPGSSGSEADQVTRLVRGAVDDLRRGETARGAAALKSVLLLDPMRAEAHWYLARLDRQRGRYDSSERHLQSFLTAAGGEFEPFRKSAEQRLVALADERRLADRSIARGEFRLVASEAANFRIHVDSELDGIQADYASMALRYLEDARGEVSRQLGVEPQEPLGVVFYGRARYDEQHRDRFSFATVGFFDGRIHVASPAHPSKELRSLLFHEYTHALFREQTGGDRPYWLNEGLAERVERYSRRQVAPTYSERAALRVRIESHSWIPLRSLAQSFSGLSNEDARIAYLESLLAAEWIESRTTAAQRARLLDRLGAGFSVDQGLHEMVGVDTDGLDAALAEQIRSEFPERSDVPARSEVPKKGDLD